MDVLRHYFKSSRYKTIFQEKKAFPIWHLIVVFQLIII